MEKETLDSIAETINSRYDDDLYYAKDADCSYIVKDTPGDNVDFALGYGVTKLALEEHGVIPIKTLHIPEEDVIHIWFRELETKEITKEVHTI